MLDLPFTKSIRRIDIVSNESPRHVGMNPNMTGFATPMRFGFGAWKDRSHEATRELMLCQKCCQSWRVKKLNDYVIVTKRIIEINC